MSEISTKENTDEALSLAFFELANVPMVGYRVEPSLVKRSKKKKQKKKKRAKTINIHQDISACGNHTGGIVWETSYLLINYLLTKQKKLGNVLEVGAGCGLLGQVLAFSGYCKRVVLTEIEEAMSNLEANRERNQNLFKRTHVSTRRLDWCQYKRDAGQDLEPHSFDTIVGTDVIFTPSLVKPLLATLQYMAHEKTKVYLCLQIRCEDSHKLFLATASDYNWKVKDESKKELGTTPECSWGLQMDCHLLKLTRTSSKKRKSIMPASAEETSRKRPMPSTSTDTSAEV